jgi:hypothetical protein
MPAKKGALCYLRRFLLVALPITGWVVAFRYHVDLVVVNLVTKISQTDLSKVYGDLAGTGRFFYGPITVVLYQPFKWIPTYRALEVVWLTLQTFWYVIFWVVLQKLYAPLFTHKFWIWLAVFLFALNPIHNNYQSGNIQLMLCAALIAAEYLSHERKEDFQLVAGILVALCAAIKVFPAYMLLYFLLMKPTRVRVGLAAGLSLAVLLPVLVFGIDGAWTLFQGFHANLFTYQSDNPLTRIPDILCLPSFLARIMAALSVSPILQKIIMATAVGIVGGGTLLWTWLNRKQIRRDDDLALHAFSLAMAVMALINPSTRVHYFIFFVPAFCSVWVLMKRARGLLRKDVACGLAFVFVTVSLTTQGVLGKTLNDQLEHWSVPTIGLIALTVMLFWLIRRQVALRT